jgi:acetolactate synthase-1/2/3 large subunit
VTSEASEPALVAEALLDSLMRCGVEVVFANAGTDFASIIEVLVKARSTGQRVPRFLTVPHENVAVAMAHGFHRATGAPVAAMVHVTVGTANASCALMNASRDGIPLLLMAGRSPISESGQVGSRTAPIHWGQESFDPGGAVREYVKWDYELRAGQSVETVVERALDIALSEPRGPVYLTLPREVLASSPSEQAVETARRPLGALPAPPSVAALDEVAELVGRSARPLLVTSQLGRAAGAFDALTLLAERFAIPVVQPGCRALSLASRHPMNLGHDVAPYLDWADLMLVMDCEVPWIPVRGEPAPGCRVVQIGTDPLFARYPIRTHRADLAIAGRAADALPLLAEMLDRHVTPEDREVRRQAIAALQAERAARRLAQLEAVRTRVPIHPLWLAACVNAAKSEDAIVVNELGVPVDALELSQSGTYLSISTAGGLGFGLGAALGVKLARPERDVIAITGDGSQIFGNPVAAYFVANAERLAPLVIVSNNARWNAVRTSALKVHPDGHMRRAESLPLVSLEPSPRFDAIMAACGGHGEAVEDPAELPAVLKRALQRTRDGTPVVVNVATGPGEGP